ncbi:hypothetical protein GCM10010909_13020 [Acidocella aquatica]|uniref:Transposase n=1 Tax=Acidocella aquatica TaxID=1922313 RepID=A0ABQ6A7S8_9PROT|nr:transposase [Acidocella aquatica]GLR66622.1 hypothetical protein GCM10010909_13020 [Acidocella aquatica]
MSQKSSTSKPPTEAVVRDIRRATRRHYSAEDKIRIVLEGLRGEHSISELCRREGIAESMYYSWSKEFLEAGTGTEQFIVLMSISWVIPKLPLRIHHDVIDAKASKVRGMVEKALDRVLDSSVN